MVPFTRSNCSGYKPIYLERGRKLSSLLYPSKPASVDINLFTSRGDGNPRILSPYRGSCRSDINLSTSRGDGNVVGFSLLLEIVRYKPIYLARGRKRFWVLHVVSFVIEDIHLFTSRGDGSFLSYFGISTTRFLI